MAYQKGTPLNMRKIILSLILSLSVSTAFAKYTFIIPQKPGGGTSVWAEIVAKQLEPFLGERIVLKHIPGARDIPGFNKWHEQLRFDDKVVMVSHGGNGVAFLQENVKYNYAEYDNIGLMNLNIISAKLKDSDMNPIKFAAGSGMVPEAFAFTMLKCGPKKSIDDYVECFDENVIWVKGMSGGERRLAFKRGELNGTRENPAAYKKHVAPNENAELWFHHGILQSNGTHNDDPNYPGYQFENLFEKKWGTKPQGKMYNAYKLVKSFRDGLQKALWVNKGNPNKDVLVTALTKMTNDSKAMKLITKKVGNYDWIIGTNGNSHRDTLMTLITKDALKTLIQFNTKALGLSSVYKTHLVIYEE